MKTHDEVVNSVIDKVQRQRKRTLIKTLTAVAVTMTASILLVAFSNIITFDTSPYRNSYQKYLAAYATPLDGTDQQAVSILTDTDVAPDAALRILDKNSAVVSIGQTAYPCSLKAQSNRQFTLDPIGETTEQAPPYFYVSFWDDKAELSWELNGITIKKVLSVTEEYEIPTGLWASYATDLGTNQYHMLSGSSWILIRDDGIAYACEGSEVYLARFISINNVLLQCLFSSNNGQLLDAALCAYDTVTFDFPTICEHLVSDASYSRIWYRAVPQEERINFDGAVFHAKGLTRSAYNEQIPEHEVPFPEAAQWRLWQHSSTENELLKVDAKLALSQDGSASLNVSGKAKYNGTISGSWYSLHQTVLVVLDQSHPLTGKAFTIFAPNSFDGNPTQEDFDRYACTQASLYKVYKLGYHTFQYMLLSEHVSIYWGADWTNDQIIPSLLYETEYMLDGKFIPARFSPDPSASKELTPMLDNGKISLVFHENMTVTVTRTSNGNDSPEVATMGFSFYDGNVYVEFDSKITLKMNDSSSYKLGGLNIGGSTLYLTGETDLGDGVMRTYLDIQFHALITA